MTQTRTILAALLLVIVIGCSDMSDSSYATLADATRAGAISRGWVPQCLPSSANAIKERHDIDSNRGWVVFQYGIADSAVFLQALEEVPSDSIQFLQVTVPNVQWWHSSLKAGELSKASSQGGFRFFKAPFVHTNDAGSIISEQWTFALRQSEGIGYGWVTSAIRPKAAGV